MDYLLLHLGQRATRYFCLKWFYVPLEDGDELLIYQLELKLRGCRPPIWRRIQVRPRMTLHRLHGVLQVAMGWRNVHLHEFRFGDKVSGALKGWEAEAPGVAIDERGTRLGDLLRNIGESFEYRYDLADNWQHDLQLEEILRPLPGWRYPVCLGGARSAPPEDVGGVIGYEAYLAAISDETHPEHEERLSWRGPFDPEEFSIEQVNGRFREVFPERAKKGKAGRAQVTPVFVKEMKKIIGALSKSGELGTGERIRLQRDERIPFPFSAQERELLKGHGCWSPELKSRLGDAAGEGICYLTLSELGKLAHCARAEVVGAVGEKAAGWTRLLERIDAIQDTFTDGGDDFESRG